MGNAQRARYRNKVSFFFRSALSSKALFLSPPVVFLIRRLLSRANLLGNHSAWLGYVSNNNANNYQANPLFDGSPQSGNVSLEFGNGIQSPGLVQLTVCPLSSLIRADTLLVGTIPNITSFASNPCPSNAFWNCPTLPCNGITSPGSH